jgi:hypothetical protein
VAVAAHRDHDGDGSPDLTATVHRLDELYPYEPVFSGFVVSPRAGAVIGGRRKVDVAWIGEQPTDPPLRFWTRIGLLAPGRPEWSTWTEPYTEEGVDEGAWQRPDPARRVEVEVLRPDLSCLEACGDLDRDGVLDWLGLAEAPPAVVVLSGADGGVLRAIPMEAWPMATVAAGGFELDDVDGDRVLDWIVGCHVSQSAARVEPRACALGLIALVSGADWHVIRSLERESFLAGPALRASRVIVPD